MGAVSVAYIWFDIHVYSIASDIHYFFIKRGALVCRPVVCQDWLPTQKKNLHLRVHQTVLNLVQTTVTLHMKKPVRVYKLC